MMKIYSSLTLLLAVFLVSACQAETGAPANHAETAVKVKSENTTSSSLQRVYTKLNECVEQVDNDNAAFSEKLCAGVGAYQLKVREQSPSVFQIQLNGKGRVLQSEFDRLTQDLPLETGGVIEWHMQNTDPRYMVFRLRWGTEAEPFTRNEYLVVSGVSDSRICPLLTVNVKTNKNANQKVHDEIAQMPLSPDCEVAIRKF